MRTEIVMITRARSVRIQAIQFLLCIASLTLPVSTLASNPGPKAPGKLVEANGLLVHINCTGEGHPTILLEAGLGGNSLEWHPVQQRLSQHNRVCSYDRPGYGWSELSTSPRDARTISRDLKILLEQSKETGPFLLVGHSFGGYVVRLYANEFGKNVSGIVLLDASHERFFDVLKSKRSSMLVTTKAPKSFRVSVPENLPAELKPLFKSLASRADTKLTVQSETFYFRRSADEVQWLQTLPPVPVSVISRGARGTSKDKKSQLVSRNWMAMQKDLHARLSNSEHIIATKSGHFPHLDQPDLVVDTILTMVERIRKP